MTVNADKEEKPKREIKTIQDYYHLEPLTAYSFQQYMAWTETKKVLVEVFANKDCCKGYSETEIFISAKAWDQVQSVWERKPGISAHELKEELRALQSPQERKAIAQGKWQESYECEIKVNSHCGFFTVPSAPNSQSPALKKSHCCTIL